MNKYRIIAIAGVFLIVCLTTLRRLNGVLDHDVAVFLTLSKMIAKGRVLYSDVLDPNTPAMSAVGRLSVRCSELTGVALDQCHLLVLSLIVAACLGLSSRLVLRWQGGFNLPSCSFILLAALTLFVVPGADFGRREHLMFACLLPWIVTILAQQAFRRSWLEVAAVGIAAGCGLFTKPHFILFALAIAGFELHRSQFRLTALSRETWLAGLVSISLYSLFLWCEPDFLHRIIPYTVATYGQYQQGFFAALHDASPRLLRWVFVVLLALQIKTSIPQPAETTIKPYLQLAWAYMLAGTLIVGWQGMGFEYHALPIRLAATMTAGMLALWCWQQIQNRGPADDPPRGTGEGLSTIFAAALVGLFLGFAARDLYPDPQDSPRMAMINHPLVKLLNASGPGESAYFFNSSIASSARAGVYADTAWAGHMISMYFIPIIADYAQNPHWYPSADGAKLAEIEHYSRQRILDDMQRRHPAIVLFDNKADKWYFKSPQFDYLSFLQQDPAFSELWERAGYRSDGVVPGLGDEEFQVYRRNPVDQGAEKPPG